MAPQAEQHAVTVGLQGPGIPAAADSSTAAFIRAYDPAEDDGDAPLLRPNGPAAQDQAAAVLRRKRTNIGILVCAAVLAMVVTLTVLGVTGRHRGSSSPHEQQDPGYVAPTVAHDYRSKPRRVESDVGIVAADQSRCSEIGAAVLQEGGSAVDAAVATCLCQGVMNPFASGIGGGFFMTVRSPNGTAEFIDAREVAPAAASWDMYDGMPAQASMVGGLAVAVPLELKGLYLAWQRWGRLPWARLVSPAVALAEQGFPAFPYLVSSLSPFIVELLAKDREAAQAFLIPQGAGWRAPRIGEWCCSRPTLAATLDAVGTHGVDWLYTAERAETLASEIRAAGGIMTAQDIVSAEPAVGPLIAAQVGGLEILVPPPPSSAPILELIARILAGYPTPSSAAANWQGQGSATDQELQFHHELVEAMKQGFALRLALGDPGRDPATAHAQNITRVMSAITDAQFADLLRSDLKLDGVLNVTQYGRQYNPYSEGYGHTPDDRGTTHISVVDGDRMAVGLTSTVNGPFGAFFISPSTGMLFNNEMDDFSRPDLPNAYGLAPAEANFIAPGRRPLSSMAPMIVTEGGELRLVVGASGGPRILTATLQTMVRTLLLKWDLQDAVQTPRVHHQLLPYQIMYENYTMPEMGGMTIHLPDQLRTYLESKGNTLSGTAFMLGNCQAVYAVPNSSRLVGVSDLRKDGAPAAVSPA